MLWLKLGQNKPKLGSWRSAEFVLIFTHLC